jgi:AcrR family transcriptional regulator
MIAARCGVDPAMVNHWFGGKRGLFLAAVKVPLTPADGVDTETHSDDGQSVAERMVSTFIRACDDTGGGEFAALVRSVGSQEPATRMLGEFADNIVRPVVVSRSLDQPELRVAMCSAQLLGIGMARYVLGAEPLATADPETVASLVAPGLECYLADNSACDPGDEPKISPTAESEHG